VLDQLLGDGGLLFQKMAFVKPPRIGSEKQSDSNRPIFLHGERALEAGFSLVPLAVGRDSLVAVRA